MPPQKFPFMDLAAQNARVRPAIEARMRAVIDHGQFIVGPEVGELERRLASYTGSKHCIGVSDGTTALLIALMALGIGKDDEVITTPFTFFATAGCIALLGARSVFVDIDPRTYNIDPAGIGQAITHKTRAIMAVSLFGQCADYTAINRIAGTHGLPVIEDGAQSFGASHHDRKSCALTTIGCTSFFPSKPLGCFGDGGACFTDDDELAARMLKIRSHGQEARYVHSMIGLNGRLDTLQAAVLLAKLDVFDEDLAARRASAARYTALLDKNGVDIVPYIAPGNTSAYAQYTVRVPNRERVVSSLQTNGIPCAIHYPQTIPRQPVFRDSAIASLSLPFGEAAAREVLSLPFHPFIAPDVQAEVVDCLLKAMAD